MQISIITDEISADPETAIELGAEWGVHDFELRGFFAERVPLLSAYQKQHLRNVLDEHQARLIAIGPGLFKLPYPPKQPPRLSLSWMERAAHEQWGESGRLVRWHLEELLPASLAFANEFQAGLVVIFGFDRAGISEDGPPDEVIECLQKAAQRAQAAGVQLVLENEAGFWADTGAHTAQIVSAVNHTGLAINWDPANAFMAGDQPYPAGYQEVRRLVRHVHFKDARQDLGGTREYVAEGQVDWPGQIQALHEDGYDGFISIETHLRPKVNAGLTALRRLRKLIEAAGA